MNEGEEVNNGKLHMYFVAKHNKRSLQPRRQTKPM